MPLDNEPYQAYNELCLSRIRNCWQRSGTCIPEERPNMKTNRSVDKATAPAKPIQGIPLSDEKENKFPVESNLSPERIMEGNSTATALLSQIVTQQEQLHQLRDWGINE